jgi:hypothetical protein
MNSPEDYPADIIAAADDVVTRGYNEGLVESVCRALLAERIAATERARGRIMQMLIDPTPTET